MGRALPRSFYGRGAEQVARDLLGQHLVRTLSDGAELRARITETEAYVGPHDLACHASKGRTARTQVMFGPPGRAYVYLIYGMHHMLNVVAHPGPHDAGQAVLLRAAETVESRNQPDDGAAHPSTIGPGRLARAFQVDRSLYGHPFWEAPLRIESAEAVPHMHVAVTPRIGVDYAGTWAEAPLRFLDSRSRHVSAPAASRFAPNASTATRLTGARPRPSRL